MGNNSSSSWELILFFTIGVQ